MIASGDGRVKREARRREIKLLILPTDQALETLVKKPKETNAILRLVESRTLRGENREWAPPGLRNVSVNSAPEQRETRGRTAANCRRGVAK